MAWIESNCLPDLVSDTAISSVTIKCGIINLAMLFKVSMFEIHVLRQNKNSLKNYGILYNFRK